MKEKLINKIKKNYSILYKKYDNDRKMKEDMNGLDKLAPMIGMDFSIDVPIFENDLVEMIQDIDISYTDIDKCNLYQSSGKVLGSNDFKPEIIEYLEGHDGKLYSKIVPNKNSGQFREILEKFFKHFIEEYNITHLNNVVLYKTEGWDGDRLVIEALIPKK